MTPGSTVRHASVARHVTDCATHDLNMDFSHLIMTSDSYAPRTCVKRPLSKRRQLVSNTNYRFMQVKSIAECSKGSILQYFRPSLSYHLSLSIFGWPLKTSFTVFDNLPPCSSAPSGAFCLGGNSAILWTFIKLPFVVKTFALSIFLWPFYTGS